MAILQKQNSEIKNFIIALEASVSTYQLEIERKELSISKLEQEILTIKKSPSVDTDLKSQNEILEKKLIEKENIINSQKKLAEDYNVLKVKADGISSELLEKNDENQLLKSTLQTLYGENLLKKPQDDVSEDIEASILYKYLFLGEVYLALLTFGKQAKILF
jgi:hypothetical protein